MARAVHTKVFWSGGRQAVLLPRELRVEGTEVLVRRCSRAIVIEPVPDDGWDDFWERLIPLKRSVRRWRTRAAERRPPL